MWIALLGVALLGVALLGVTTTCVAYIIGKALKASWHADTSVAV